MSWPRVALRTMPYPDITLVGLGVEWAWRYCPMSLTSQHGKIRQITPLLPKINYILKNAVTANIQRLHACVVEPESLVYKE